MGDVALLVLRYCIGVGSGATQLITENLGRCCTCNASGLVCHADVNGGMTAE